MLMVPVWIFPAFFLTAVVYALIGFGGGSSYLALLSMTAMPVTQIAAIALFCNMIVSGGGVWHFSKAGFMRPRLLWPFLITSIPAAFLGGLVKTDDSIQRTALGVCLLFVALRVWLEGRDTVRERKPAEGIVFMLSAPVIGAGLGFLSGFLGIGGGIFLSPILILAGWADIKESSAAAAVFILLNSAAGLLARGNIFHAQGIEWLTLGVLVFVGGQLGSRLGVYRLPHPFMRKILAGFISWASLRLIGLAL
jgi:hypothetical protein